MEYTLTDHATKMIAERNIEPDWVRQVLDEPALRQPDALDPALEHFYRRIEANEGRVLRVVVNTAADPARVVSVFFDRRMRGRI